MASVRDLMPFTAARIDRMRESLGVDIANAMIKRAIAGEEGCFFAMENHRTFGTPDTRVVHVMGWNESGQCVREEPRWMIEAAEFALTMGIEIEIRDMQDDEEANERAKRLRKILKDAKI